MESGVYLASLALIAILIYRWCAESIRHGNRLNQIPIRIHVNGIRGKSTVSRIVAGALREAGLTTFGKTTGSAACYILPDGKDVTIRRRGAATILEQIDFVERAVGGGAQAMVIECMAIRPRYQEICESSIVRSNIGILTNVREDHQELLGQTLPEITRSLLNTCPTGGVLVTAEQDPELQRIILDETTRRGSRLVIADPGVVADDEIQRFEGMAFKENVAIGLEVASLLGIPRDIALAGMVAAAPDPGELQIKQWKLCDKEVTWANLFAVNDRQSVLSLMDLLMNHRRLDTTLVGILNNRRDREDRALQFADITSLDLAFDRLAVLGAYEHRVTQRLIENGYPTEHILQLGEQRAPTLGEMIRELVREQPTKHVLLVGLVNIHTPQADSLVRYLQNAGPTRRKSVRTSV